MKIKSNKGVSLITLSIAIIIMIIITGTLIYRAQDSVDVKELKNMYTDIEVLNDKVSNWYTNYGDIPGKIKYDDRNKIQEIQNKGQRSDNDNDNYYIIDVKVLENVSLNYGRDINNENSSEGNSSEENSSEDIYIINEQSHKIYYPKGIESGGEIYYTNDTDEGISLATELTIKLRKLLDNGERERYTPGTWTNKSVLAEVQYPEGTADTDKKFSFNTEGNINYEVYPTEENQRTKTDTGKYEVKAKVGESGREVSKGVKIDKIKPTIEVEKNKLNNDTGELELTLKLSDEGGSKLKELKYRINNNEMKTVPINENNLAEDGTYKFSTTEKTENIVNKIYIEVEDNASNINKKTVSDGTYVAQIISIDGISISSENEDDYKFYTLKEALNKGN